MLWREWARSLKSTPSVQEIEQEKFDRSFSLYFISKVDQATLEKEILNVSEIAFCRYYYS